MNQLEELFNDRLANHSIPPPAGAWDKVATNLSKKNRTIVWVRWAAVLVIGTLAISIMMTRTSEPAEVLSDNKKIATPAERPVQNESPVATNLTVPEKKLEKKIQGKKRVEVKPNVVAVTVDPAEKEIATEAVVVAEQTVVQPTAESKVASRSMVITYTLDPVVDVVPETPVAEAKKGSSLEKVVKFARDVKNGDSPIGLRVVKEDLFAQSKKKSPTKTH